MEPKKIQISINPKGEIKIDVLNAQGTECLEWTDALEKSFGGEANRKLKDSFYVNEFENQKA